MKKKFQVFISSTYTDLIEERQVAVESVLNAGHIPAGMELFKSGDRTQKEVIKKWIEDSDVYFLILGGRYGSIDPETKKSYTHWEYDYATNLGKPMFSVVISEKGLDEKVKVIGRPAMESLYGQQYNTFKEQVLTKISRFTDDLKDIKITILESLQELSDNNQIEGWISSEEVGSFEHIQRENVKLQADILKEKEKNRKLEDKLKKVDSDLIGGIPYESIFRVLDSSVINVPDNISEKIEELNIHDLFIAFSGKLNLGVDNVNNMNDSDEFTFFRLAPQLLNFGLVTIEKLPNRLQRVKTSKEGLRYLALTKLRDQEERIAK